MHPLRNDQNLSRHLSVNCLRVKFWNSRSAKIFEIGSDNTRRNQLYKKIRHGLLFNYPKERRQQGVSRFYLLIAMRTGPLTNTRQDLWQKAIHNHITLIIEDFFTSSKTKYCSDFIISYSKFRLVITSILVLIFWFGMVCYGS